MAKPRKKVRPNLSYKRALRIAWTRGLLEYKLYPYQKELFRLLQNNNRKTVINSSRRWGKTTVLLLYAIIFAIKNPGSQVKFAAPTAKSLRKTIFPILKMLLEDKPDDLSITWSSKEECYNFFNGSQLHIHACDNGRHESLRGQRTDLGICDEGAYIAHLKYVVNDILMPQTLTCGGRLIIASTPSMKVTTGAEEFKELCMQAEALGAYFTKTIYDNKSLTKETIEEYCIEAGGPNSVTWLVEYMCQFLVDPEKKVIPEFSKDNHVGIHPVHSHKKYFHKYSSMDLGVTRDFTSTLFGYYDFLSAKIVIEDEFILKNMTTQQLVDLIKLKEAELYPNETMYRRIADSSNPLLINDMASLHNLPIISTSKTTLETMVNEVRIWFLNNKVIIHPRCKYLIGCLEYGVWADNEQGRQRKMFGRTTTYGHFDGLASLVYLIRNIDTNTNPIPYDSFLDPANTHKSGDNTSHNPRYNQFKKLFKRTN